MLVTLWLMVLELQSISALHELILVLGDNTSAIGWMFRTTHLRKENLSYVVANCIARKIASLIYHSDNFLATQHLEGKKNIIPDWLTFEGDDRIENGKPIHNPVTFDRPCNLELTRQICLHFPQDVPQSFNISTLPKKYFHLRIT